jgi:hypothetical protein
MAPVAGDILVKVWSVMKCHIDIYLVTSRAHIERLQSLYETWWDYLSSCLRKYSDIEAEIWNGEVGKDVQNWTHGSLGTYPTQRIGCYGINTRSRDNEQAKWQTNCSRWWSLVGSSGVIKGGHVVVWVSRTGVVNQFIRSIRKRVECSAVECWPADNGSWGSDRLVN